MLSWLFLNYIWLAIIAKEKCHVAKKKYWECIRDTKVRGCKLYSYPDFQ